MFIVCSLSLLNINLVAQTPPETIYDYEVLPNMDTLRINHSASDFWFGIHGGPTYNYYFGTFNYLTNPEIPFDSTLNPFTDYTGRNGYGIHFGLNFEYLPKNEFFGISLKLNAIDNRTIVMDAKSTNLATPENYEISGLMSYVSLISAVRISLPYENWYVYAGPIFEFRQYNTIIHNTELENVSNIKQERIANLPNINNRIGFHGGIGFEYLIANVVDVFRIKFSPYLSVSTGQDVFGTQVNNSNPSINTFTFQSGINLKFGPDEITYDTLRYDPTYIPPSSAYARAADDKGVSGNGFIKQEQIETKNLSLVEGSKIREQVREEPVFAQEVAKEKNETVPEKKIDVSINKQMTFYYPNSTTTELSNALKDYLTAVSDFLKTNPNNEIRIVAHTDNIGTEIEKQRISDDRGRTAKRFLMSKGINGNKILVSGLGDRQPIANSRTDEGRRKNRRIEITIAPK